MHQCQNGRDLHLTLRESHWPPRHHISLSDWSNISIRIILCIGAMHRVYALRDPPSTETILSAGFSDQTATRHRMQLDAM